jgi:hypothetical protein
VETSARGALAADTASDDAKAEANISMEALAIDAAIASEV